MKTLTPWLANRAGSVLEVGCGGAPYRQYLPDGCKYQGLDWSGASKAFGYEVEEVTYYDGNKFPFPPNYFESLFHTEVLEHIQDPHEFLRQCHKVLVDGGNLFFSVPFQARYHYIPYDYWRFTPTSLRLLLEEAGFENIEIKERGDDITVAGYKVVSVFYRLLLGSWPEKFCGCLLAPIAGLCLVIGQIGFRKPIGSRDDCLGYSVTAVKKG
ncbi:hypothetical protein SYK_15880 [Pseudodesulfovibrio nedwellii]|uniref:Class I SAM-dependent methyltransferase n=2 Tax=Pseudodesulfovibrio nedwellii TaxID=2973072 RepID=A0ABN6S4Y4_9BACT|nr:class I SAM-dependent methyltransferase [Pseudodesulfovibrio nedwellii]BDQ37228.1 hypothetical protein SYK_15880 [Pseudodesulfovibrio nedwellii]